MSEPDPNVTSAPEGPVPSAPPSMDTLNPSPMSPVPDGPPPQPLKPETPVPVHDLPTHAEETVPLSLPQPDAPTQLAPTPPLGPEMTTPISMLGSLDRPTTPIVQTHEGPMPASGIGAPSPQSGTTPTKASDHRAYLLFLIGLGVLFFISLAVAYLLK